MVNNTNSPDPNKHVYIMRIWRTDENQPWHYTIVTTNLDTKHHFNTLAEAMAFVDPTRRGVCQ